jgi:hypothetical protein
MKRARDTLTVLACYTERFGLPLKTRLYRHVVAPFGSLDVNNVGSIFRMNYNALF